MSLPCVVIGGGIAGASAALHLAEGGADVVLVDDAREGRATHAGAGIVGRPWRDPESPLFALRRRAVAAYPELAARIGASLDVVGGLFVAPPGALLDEAQTLLTRARAGEVHRLDAGEAAAAFPFLAPGLAAIHVGTTARVHGDDIRDRLLRAALAAGAEFVSGTAAVEQRAGEVQGVRVGERLLRARDVVLAAGSWSAGLAGAVAAPLPVEPQRGQILHLGVEHDTSRMPVVQPLDGDHYLLPFPDRRIVVGATRETGSGFDPRLTAGGVAEVLTDALTTAPGLGGATLRELRVGLRPATRDGNPVLGSVPGCQGLWALTGMGPQGLTIGPYCGSLIAEAVLGREPELDLEPFSAARPI